MCATTRTLVLLLATSVLASCGDSPATTGASQVAVKVNKDEISVHQVNAQLSRASTAGMTPDQQRQAKKQVIEGLVEQQLLVEQALDKKLDRDPEVLNALESTRRQVLAQAYVQKTLAGAAKPSDEEIKKYYDANPALFAKRRVFRLQELATNIPADKLPELEQQISRTKSMNDVASWLRANGYQVAGSTAVRGAEQLPLASLARISEMSDGEMGAFQADRRITVLQVVQSQAVPLTEKEAAPLIEQFLANQKRDVLARAEVKRLRDAAKVEYIGDFASIQTPEDSKAEPAAKSGAMPAGAATMDKTAVDKTAADKTAIEKGVSGLR